MLVRNRPLFFMPPWRTRARGKNRENFGSSSSSLNCTRTCDFLHHHIRMVQAARAQDRIGVILSPSVVKHNLELTEQTKLSWRDDDRPAIFNNFPWSLTIQRYNEIPLSSEDYNGFSIVPRSQNIHTARWLVPKFIHIRLRLSERLGSRPPVDRRARARNT